MTFCGTEDVGCGWDRGSQEEVREDFRQRRFGLVVSLGAIPAFVTVVIVRVPPGGEGVRRRSNAAMAAGSAGLPRIARMCMLASAPNHRDVSNVVGVAGDAVRLEQPLADRARCRPRRCRSAVGQGTDGGFPPRTRPGRVPPACASPLTMRSVNARSMAHSCVPIPEAAFERTSWMGWVTARAMPAGPGNPAHRRETCHATGEVPKRPVALQAAALHAYQVVPGVRVPFDLGADDVVRTSRRYG